MAGTQDSKVTTYSVKNGKDAITPAVLVAILNKAMRDKKLDPDTPIVVDHTGSPVGLASYRGRLPGRYADWAASMRRLAACPNVSAWPTGRFWARDVPTVASGRPLPYTCTLWPGALTTTA